MQKFAHIMKEDFSIGIIHLNKPRCTLWHGAGFGDDYFEWHDKPTISEATQIMLELEMKEVELGYSGSNAIPLLKYEELFN